MLADAATEEARAQLWRDQVARRVAYQTELWQALAGDPAAADRVRGAWAAVELWQMESHEPETEPEDDYDVDPLHIADTVNVGT